MIHNNNNADNYFFLKSLLPICILLFLYKINKYYLCFQCQTHCCSPVLTPLYREWARQTVFEGSCWDQTQDSTCKLCMPVYRDQSLIFIIIYNVCKTKFLYNSVINISQVIQAIDGGREERRGITKEKEIEVLDLHRKQLPFCKRKHLFQ